MKEKRKSGQPTTFTDFFGLMVAEHLLGPSVSNSVFFIKIFGISKIFNDKHSILVAFPTCLTFT